jgi:hypothetical protein
MTLVAHAAEGTITLGALGFVAADESRVTSLYAAASCAVAKASSCSTGVSGAAAAGRQPGGSEPAAGQQRVTTDTCGLRPVGSRNG